MGSEDIPECPLCMEPLDVDERNFYPCACLYQVCRFCWHRIRMEGEHDGRCPACRRPYEEEVVCHKPTTEPERKVVTSKEKKKDLSKRQKLVESRKRLSSLRVVQNNLVFVVGLSHAMSNEEVLKQPQYFGKFGKIMKVVINNSTTYAGSQGPSSSAYVTYSKSEEALRALESMNNTRLVGRIIKVSLGTTKYCSFFLKGFPCNKADCMYLHEECPEEASFTKEEMQSNKHLEYEQRLRAILIAEGRLSSGSTAIPVHRKTGISLEDDQKGVTATESDSDTSGRRPANESQAATSETPHDETKEQSEHVARMKCVSESDTSANGRHPHPFPSDSNCGLWTQPQERQVDVRLNCSKGKSNRQRNKRRKPIKGREARSLETPIMRDCSSPDSALEESARPEHSDSSDSILECAPTGSPNLDSGIVSSSSPQQDEINDVSQTDQNKLWREFNSRPNVVISQSTNTTENRIKDDDNLDLEMWNETQRGLRDLLTDERQTINLPVHAAAMSRNVRMAQQFNTLSLNRYPVNRTYCSNLPSSFPEHSTAPPPGFGPPSHYQSLNTVQKDDGTMILPNGSLRAPSLETPGELNLLDTAPTLFPSCHSNLDCVPGYYPQNVSSLQHLQTVHASLQELCPNANIQIGSAKGGVNDNSSDCSPFLRRQRNVSPEERKMSFVDPAIISACVAPSGFSSQYAYSVHPKPNHVGSFNSRNDDGNVDFWSTSLCIKNVLDSHEPNLHEEMLHYSRTPDVPEKGGFSDAAAAHLKSLWGVHDTSRCLSNNGYSMESVWQ